MVQLLMQLGAKVRATSGALIDLQTTHLSRLERTSLPPSTWSTLASPGGSDRVLGGEISQQFGLGALLCKSCRV